ncbi:MMPL family transporter [Solirubrobacter ginsenosidimutans]|uniref:MMPL family transporter n=1 Tax=Solirubrobacter ginsenosidimutans TaxID=490573 RepID=A0A9X3RYM3_9ACTN|nr:MMPL family transporter [Solirubrobacter ginsenosidimutans]MDA0159840.1 MMPL family transporter [Solirubrobacter ginsenosidimutans]
MLSRITAIATGRRTRRIVIVVWLLLAVGLGTLQPRLQQRAQDESRTFRTRGAESTQVHDLLDRRFAEGRQATSVLAYEFDKGSIETQEPAISQDLDRICNSDAVPDVVGVGGADGVACGDLGHHLGPETPPSAFSNDTPPSTVLLSVVNAKDDTESVVKYVDAIRKVLPGPKGGPLRSYVTGEAAFDADRSAAVSGIDATLLAITGALVLVLMLLIYRSPLIAALMLLVVMLAYLIATGLVYLLVAAGATTVSGQSAAILIVLMFGAGTDYALLIVSRYRDELRAGSDPQRAMADAAQRTGPAILASGGIVVAAMLVLIVADFNATREMGPILALGIAVMVLCGLTLLPAVLVELGQAAFWPAFPRQRSRGGETGTGWSRVADLVSRRPRLLAGVSVAVLAAGALGNLHGRGYLDLTEQYRTPPESVQGQELIAKRYPPGRAVPVDVVTTSRASLPVRDALRHAKGVAEANTDSQSLDGKLVSSEVMLSVDPLSQTAMDSIARLRSVARQAAGPHELALVGGVTAEQQDNLQALRRDTELIVPLVLLLVLLVLIVLLRCVIAPLYVVATVVLSFAFALGVSSLAFTYLFGKPDSDPNEAIFAFIFLVALGVDDNIFLMTRIREERAAGLSTRDAVLTGLRRTGGVITSAGLILAGTFASLMALDLESLFQVGFIVTLGLLVDAFIVRTLLVPSVALLLGEHNWWPRVRHRPLRTPELTGAV